MKELFKIHNKMKRRSDRIYMYSEIVKLEDMENELEELKKDLKERMLRRIEREESVR